MRLAPALGYALAGFVPIVGVYVASSCSTSWYTTDSNPLLRAGNSNSGKVSSSDLVDLKGDMWWESSDTVRRPGKSKAVFTTINTQMGQHAMLFVSLDPQPNGACFAGVKHKLTQPLGDATGVLLRVRAKGELAYWKVVLTVKGSPAPHDSNNPTYQALFRLDPTADEWRDVNLPFASFKAVARGKDVPSAPPFDPRAVDSVGLQAYGGVYEVEKQRGVGVLEIERIVAVFVGH
jgi:hypothetical protein